MVAGLAACLAAMPVACAQTRAVAVPLVLPTEIVYDAQGNLYFCETSRHAVRMVSPAGILTTVAGTGIQGFSGDGGPAANAALDSPQGLALDAAGNLYVADTHNQRIRRIALATGTIATVAGTGAVGFSGDGGAALAAKLDLPGALAVDAGGSVYVADTNNHRVRRIDGKTGVITTVAGDGAQGFAGDGGLATAAAIDSPGGVAVDAVGDVFVADTHNGRIRKVTAATGIITTIAGSGVALGGFPVFAGDGGAATGGTLALPRGVTVDALGNVYVADVANHRIRRISAGGVLTTVAGQGSELYAGDEAPAVSASLDSPRSVTLSPAGLVTLADTGNERIRQIDALPAPGPDIHTIAGLGVTTPGMLALSAPAVVYYGSGSVVASLTAAGQATGNVTFLESVGGASLTLGTAGLASNAASFSTGGMAAGIHGISATYGGDATHGAAQSNALALTISPLGVIAAANSTSVLYGLAVPVLSGTLTGVLPRDVGQVAAVFGAGAGLLSPAGVYPATAVLTGSAAANYTVSTTGALTVAQAPTVTTLMAVPAASGTTVGAGAVTVFTVAALSTTSGVPTGSATLIDGGTVIARLPLASGAASLATVLSAGSHSVAAAYGGDGNFLPSLSSASTVTVGGGASPSDFAISSAGPSTQTVAAGSAATFGFAVTFQGAALTGPIDLAVQGVPLGATSSINPAYIPPGGAVTTFAVTVQTPKAELLWPVQGHPGRGPVQIALALWWVPVAAWRRGGRRRFGAKRLRCVGSIALLLLLAGCGDRISSLASTGKTYTLVVTGSATSPSGTLIQHSTSVTLQVF